VLLNITGDSILRTCVVPLEVLPARVSQHVSIVRSNSDVDPLFLQKWLTLPAIKDHMLGHSSGGTRKAITKGHIESFPISVPPVPEQRGIAATLGALDGKIESNVRVLAKLRSLARALYQSAVAEGGEEVSIGDVVEFHNRRRVPLSAQEREARPGDVPYYGATGVFGYVDDFLFDEVLVLVGEDGSVANPDGTPFLQYIWGKAWINNHAHALTGREISTELLFFALEQSDVRPLVTGAVQPKLNMGNLKSLMVRVPTGAARSGLEHKVASLMSLHRARSDENRRLGQLREALLPELLAGHIRVPEAAVVTA
jgi:type I restriction enzyme, S subunit